jgi:O-antigen/teichoic acid export membrane protein
MPFIVHRLGDHNYGYWALVASVLGYYGILDLGIVTAVQYQVAKSLGDAEHDSANRTISTAFYAFAVLGIVIFALTVIVAALARSFIAGAADVSLFRIVLVIMGAGFAVGFPGRAFVGAIAAHMRFDLGVSVSLIVLALRTALILVIIGAGGGLVSLALISLVSDAVGYVLSYLILRRIQVGLKIRAALASIKTLRGLFNYSGYALLIQIADQLRFSLDGWVVSVFVGVSAVTHYSIASRLSQAFMALIIAAVGILSPWFSQMLGSSDFSGIRRVFIMGTKVSASLSTIVASSLILYGYVFVERWMGKQYVDAYWPLVFLVSAIYCDVAQLPSVSYMFGVSRHRFLAWVTLAEGIANLGLSLYWARRYGMAGVALGTLVPMFIAKLFIQPIYVCKHLQIPLATYYFKLLGRSIGPPALGAVILWKCFLEKLYLPNIALVCVVIISQAVVCGLLSFIFAFTSAERQFVLTRIFSPRSVSPQTEVI